MSETLPADSGSYDTIIIGAGHNGLVAGFYLARAGLSPLILERREIVGGCCVTESIGAGYRASTASHVLSMLRPSIWRDMRLAARGLTVEPAGPGVHVFADGEYYRTSENVAETVAETRRLSAKDAEAIVAFNDHLAELATAIMPLYDRTAPDPRMRDLTDVRANLRLARDLVKSRHNLADLSYLFTTSTAQYLSEWFESEHVKASMAATSILDSTGSPSTPGTAFKLLHDHASGGTESSGGARAWGFVRGGMGAVTAAIRDAAVEAGAHVRTGAEVAQILVDDGKVGGVVLVGGEEIRSSRVISNADPKRTFLQMMDPERDLPQDFAKAIRSARGSSTSLRIHLGVSELPYLKALPEGGVQPYHRGLVDATQFIADLERQQEQVRAGAPADPAQIEVCFPSVHDPSMAPEGKHLLDIVVLSQPYSGPDWDRIKEARADRAIAQLTEFFPKLPELIEHRQVLSPLDQERLFGMTEAHYAHLEMSPDQLLFMRPARGYGDYRTPVDGLYLCGAGTHPGGGVSGANGRNAAREILRDAGKKLG